MLYFNVLKIPCDNNSVTKQYHSTFLMQLYDSASVYFKTCELVETQKSDLYAKFKSLKYSIPDAQMPLLFLYVYLSGIISIKLQNCVK